MDTMDNPGSHITSLRKCFYIVQPHLAKAISLAMAVWAITLADRPTLTDLSDIVSAELHRK